MCAGASTLSLSLTYIFTSSIILAPCQIHPYPAFYYVLLHYLQLHSSPSALTVLLVSVIVASEFCCLASSDCCRSLYLEVLCPSLRPSLPCQSKNTVPVIKKTPQHSSIQRRDFLDHPYLPRPIGRIPTSPLTWWLLVNRLLRKFPETNNLLPSLLLSQIHFTILTHKCLLFDVSATVSASAWLKQRVIHSLRLPLHPSTPLLSEPIVHRSLNPWMSARLALRGQATHNRSK